MSVIAHTERLERRQTKRDEKERIKAERAQAKGTKLPLEHDPAYFAQLKPSITGVYKRKIIKGSNCFLSIPIEVVRLMRIKAGDYARLELNLNVQTLADVNQIIFTILK